MSARPCRTSSKTAPHPNGPAGEVLHRGGGCRSGGKGRGTEPITFQTTGCLLIVLRSQEPQAACMGETSHMLPRVVEKPFAARLGELWLSFQADNTAFIPTNLPFQARIFGQQTLV